MDKIKDHLSEEDYISIGNRIRKARIEKDIIQEDLAEVLDVSVYYISKIERGKTKVSLKRLTELCLILGKDMNYFLQDILYIENNKSRKEAILEITKKLDSLTDHQIHLIYDLINNFI